MWATYSERAPRTEPKAAIPAAVASHEKAQGLFHHWSLANANSSNERMKVCTKTNNKSPKNENLKNRTQNKYAHRDHCCLYSNNMPSHLRAQTRVDFSVLGQFEEGFGLAAWG